MGCMQGGKGPPAGGPGENYPWRSLSTMSSAGTSSTAEIAVGYIGVNRIPCTV